METATTIRDHRKQDLNDVVMDFSDSNHATDSQERTLNMDGDCQVCVIRGLKDDLTNITKIIQDKNEQLAKLKAKRMRSFFERQILE